MAQLRSEVIKVWTPDNFGRSYYDKIPNIQHAAASVLDDLHGHRRERLETLIGNLCGYTKQKHKYQTPASSAYLMRLTQLRDFTTPNKAMQAMHVYEVRPRKDKRGVDLISDVLPFGRLWYGDTNAVANAIGYAEHFSRSHDAVIHVYDESGNVIETHKHAGDFKE